MCRLVHVFCSVLIKCVAAVRLFCLLLCCGRFLLYLLLFLDCHISNSIICIIVSVNFLVDLFLRFRGVSVVVRYKFFPISFVSISWRCVQIFCILEHFVNKCKLPYVSPQWSQFGLLLFEH